MTGIEVTSGSHESDVKLCDEVRISLTKYLEMKMDAVCHRNVFNISSVVFLKIVALVYSGSQFAHMYIYLYIRDVDTQGCRQGVFSARWHLDNINRNLSYLSKINWFMTNFVKFWSF